MVVVIGISQINKACILLHMLHDWCQLHWSSHIYHLTFQGMLWNLEINAEEEGWENQWHKGRVGHMFQLLFL